MSSVTDQGREGTAVHPAEHRRARATPPPVDGVLRIRLRVWRSYVQLPSPTQEHGGLRPVPAGAAVLLDIGAAHDIHGLTSWHLAGALRWADRITVVGDDPWGITRVRSALDLHLAQMAVRQ